MFVYCKNNPALTYDPSGTIPKFSPEYLEALGEYVDTAVGPLLYVTLYNKKGALLEYWVDKTGKVVQSRHHTNHGNGKQHPVVPHDHEWYDDDDGNNTENKHWERPNPGFKAPDSNNKRSDKMNFASLGMSVVIAGFVVYETTKWVIAIFTAPVTCGGSLIVAGGMP